MGLSMRTPESRWQGSGGLISAIGYRDEKYPFTVDVQDGDAYKQYFFGEDEIELED